MNPDELNKKIKERTDEAVRKELLLKIFQVYMHSSDRFVVPGRVDVILEDLEVSGDYDLEFDPTRDHYHVQVSRNGRLLFEAKGTQYSGGSLSQRIDAYVPGDWEDIINHNVILIQEKYKERQVKASEEREIQRQGELEDLAQRFGL